MDFRECNKLVATLDGAMAQLSDVRYCLFALVIAAYVMIVAKVADYYFTCIRRPSGYNAYYQQDFGTDGIDGDGTQTPIEGLPSKQIIHGGYAGDTDAETGRLVGSQEYRQRRNNAPSGAGTGQHHHRSSITRSLQQHLASAAEEYYKKLGVDPTAAMYQTYVEADAHRMPTKQPTLDTQSTTAPGSAKGSPTRTKSKHRGGDPGEPLYCECKSPVPATPEATMTDDLLPSYHSATTTAAAPGGTMELPVETARSEPPDSIRGGERDTDTDGDMQFEERIVGVRYPPIHQSSI